MMMRGVISFAVASVFLLVLVSSAARLPQRAPDPSYQSLLLLSVQQEAVEAAFSDALSDAAAKAAAASAAEGAPGQAQAAARAAAYVAALSFQEQLRAQGYDVAFWCGKAGEGARQAASGRMALEGRAAVPEGALALSNPGCAGEFDVNLLKLKLRVRHAGFSLYSRAPGIGHAAQFPENFEVDIGG